MGEPIVMGHHAPGKGHVPFVEVFQRHDGLYDWHLRSGNGEILCGSVQGFRDKWSAKASYDTAMVLLGAGPEVRFKTNGD